MPPPIWELHLENLEYSMKALDVTIYMHPPFY